MENAGEEESITPAKYAVLWGLNMGKVVIKIVLKVNKQDEFEELKNKLKRSGIPFQVVKDAGQTQVPPGTETAIGIGPYYTDEINRITAKLKLL